MIFFYGTFFIFCPFAFSFFFLPSVFRFRPSGGKVALVAPVAFPPIARLPISSFEEGDEEGEKEEEEEEEEEEEDEEEEETEEEEAPSNFVIRPFRPFPTFS